MFYLTTHSTHFYGATYAYMASDMARTIQIAREETR